MSDERAEQLVDALEEVRARIGRAAQMASRDSTDITLVAVTKRFPAADVVRLWELGVTDVAENRHQEAADKHAEVVGLLGGSGPKWHFVGQLQSNKAKAIAAYSDSVDTVDRPQLVSALSAGALRAGREIDVLVQVSLAADPEAERHRGGCPPAEVARLAQSVAVAPGLRLGGVMGMAPLGGDPEAAFAILAATAALVQEAHPQADQISAGMSGDLEAAIAAGATQVRLGTALLGERPTLR